MLFSGCYATGYIVICANVQMEIRFGQACSGNLRVYNEQETQVRIRKDVCIVL